jgi:hypothetical protein
MKKEMEQVLQETIKVEHSISLKGVKLPKINFEEIVIFQNRSKTISQRLPKNQNQKIRDLPKITH